MNLDLLPEDCFSYILSLTSPADACRVSLVSSSVRWSADSDRVWEKFLPSDYPDILSRLAFPLASSSSKKELFFNLCSPHLIDGGQKIFSLEKSTGKKRFMLSARELSITWSDNPLYWSWKPYFKSRFAEAAELRTICRLQIQAAFKTQMLSPNTHYGAYLVVKFANRAYGLDTLPSEVSLKVGSLNTQSKVYLHWKKEGIAYKQDLDWMEAYSRAPRGPFISLRQHEEGRSPHEREDGWVEIELGSFYNWGGDDEEEVHTCLQEINGVHLKGGLIVEGIELRPN